MSGRRLAAVLAAVVLSVAWTLVQAAAQGDRPFDPLPILREIDREIAELGPYQGEDFLKQEFWFELDGLDANKEEHIVILTFPASGDRRMYIQITYFEPVGRNVVIKNALETRLILCLFNGEDLTIAGCMYSEKEMEELLPDLLEGIIEEKKLLRMKDWS